MTAVSCYLTHVDIPSHESVSVLMKSLDIKESQDEISSYLVTSGVTCDVFSSTDVFSSEMLFAHGKSNTEEMVKFNILDL